MGGKARGVGWLSSRASPLCRMAGLYGALLSGSSLALPPLKPETPDAGLQTPADEGARALAAAEQRLQMQLQRLHNPPMKVYIGLQNTARMEEHAHEDEGECGRRAAPGTAP